MSESQDTLSTDRGGGGGRAPHARGTQRGAPHRGRRDVPDEARTGLLAAAAKAFAVRGFAATSIDDVARRLGATKGLVYHYYRSKSDLFFDVCLSGMALDFAAIEPPAAAPDRAVSRLAAMALSHVRVMMEKIDFQHVILQGVSLHLSGPTTPGDRETLARLIAERDRYETLFRGVIEAGRREGDLADFSDRAPGHGRGRDASIAGKAFLSIINSPVFWYRERDGETPSDREAIARDLAIFALAGAGASRTILEEEFPR